MLSLQENSESKKRTAHIAAIRASLKCIPVLKLNSGRVRSGLKTKTSLNTNQSEISNEEFESSNSIKEEERSAYFDSKTYNSFLEKYELLEKLGEGGNGCVYRCLHKASERIYAVKKMKVQEQYILQIKRNFIYIQKLSHPAICSYKALYFDQNQRYAFLVMEYFPFPNLSQITLQSEEEIKSVVKQIILGLEYLHKQNICHRDVKPQNILYDQKEGKVKIIDFGIAKRTFSRGARRDMLTIIGTPSYFAPEIYIGGGYNEKVDIWALGVTIYKLIANCTPFESQYHSDTISNILKGQVRFNEKVWSKYSHFAKDFVTRLLKKKCQRMNLSQSLKHLWMQFQEVKRPKKVRKLSSFSLDISEQFRIEMRNFQEATSKEQGSTKIFQGFGKKIKLINVKEYDLQDPECPEIKEQPQQEEYVRPRKFTI